MDLKLSETNNIIDSNGSFLGIEGNWFLLPLAGIISGGVIGILKQSVNIALILASILGISQFYIARFLSKQHKGWLKFFFAKIACFILREPYLKLHARRLHHSQFNPLWRSK